MNTPRTPFSRRPAARGFTLIEIMVVVGIIVILAGISLAVGASVKRKAARQYTESTLNALDSALLTYKRAGNPLPPVTGTAFAWPNWAVALKSFPDSATALKNLKTDPTGNFLDGYNQPFQCIIPATATEPVHFVSNGVNGAYDNGAGDDLVSTGVGL